MSTRCPVCQSTACRFRKVSDATFTVTCAMCGREWDEPVPRDGVRRQPDPLVSTEGTSLIG